MKYISLLPPEIRAQAKIQQQQRYFLWGGGLAILLCLGIFWVLVTMNLQAEAKLKVLQGQRTTIEGRSEGYKEYTKLQTRVQNVESLAQQAMGKSPDWVQLIAEVNRCLPPNVWMTEFRVSLSTEVKKDKTTDKTTDKAVETYLDKATASPEGVFIQGWAADYSAVAQWLEGLNKVSSLSNVSCQYTKQQPNENQTRVNFEISAAVRPEAIPRATVTGGNGK